MGALMPAALATFTIVSLAATAPESVVAVIAMCVSLLAGQTASEFGIDRSIAVQHVRAARQAVQVDFIGFHKKNRNAQFFAADSVRSVEAAAWNEVTQSQGESI